MARRSVISHLTVQWLMELAHKFNQRLTLMDSERFESSLEEAPGINPWSCFPRCIASLELLHRNELMRDAVAEAGASWDLAIFDEAQLEEAARRARAGMEAELEAAKRRTKLSLEHQGVQKAVVDAALEEDLAHGARLLKALSGVKVVLDSACAFVLNR